MNVTGIIHIGAHYGIFEEECFRNLGVKEQMFFEPIKYGWGILEANFKYKYPIFQLAVGNDNRPVIMHVDHDNSAMSSSILTPKKHLEYYPNVRFVEDIEVQMIKLDTFFRLGIPGYNMLNIDVQGYELEVLKGAENLIDLYVDYICTETSLEELYENCALLSQVDEFLSPKFDRVEFQLAHKSFGDALYIRKEPCEPPKWEILDTKHEL
jgi:FkbM family methyltransferase